MFLDESYQGAGSVLHAMFPSTGDNMLHNFKKDEHKNNKLGTISSNIVRLCLS